MSYVFLDISIGTSPSNRVILELFDTLAPQTCTFFKSLVASTPGYKSTTFHRIIEDFMIQGGNVSESTLEHCPTELENTQYKVDKPGLVGMARTNSAEVNAQFFITLVEAEHLTGNHTIFGRVVKGMEVVERIGRLEVDEEDRPVDGKEVVIVNCGELQQRQKKEDRTSASPERKRKCVEERERSVSPRRETETDRRRSRPSRDEKEERRRRSGSRDEERRHRYHHRHHRHHHRSENGDDREPQHSKEESRPEHSERRHSHRGDREDDTRGDAIPTGPRAYRDRRQYRPESNYGRLGHDAGYYDWRDDEDRLRDIERQRDSERGKQEPEIIFKGRGAMKFRERTSFGRTRY